MNLKGIHHVSSLTANAEKNLDFYTRILGLRLVKKTVNQDNTAYYHLFYGDEEGKPGTELTFFEIPNLAEKHPGTNSISSISLRVKNDEALVYWQKRFEALGVDHHQITERFGNAILPFIDLEGHQMRLISDQQNKGEPGGKAWTGGGIPEQYGIIGLGPVQLTVRYMEPTEQVLTEVMGFSKIGTYQTDEYPIREIHVFETGEGGTGTQIHVEQRKDLPEERQGRGSVHHVAFRVDTEEALRKSIEEIEREGFKTSGFVDRFYFRSLYFTEPNGILYEVATDGPGFDLDENKDHLGQHLSLPTFLEHQRSEIEAKLKPLPTPKQP
ncbi:ring-cleaving dioxygenase [Alkalihalobacterium sp. APHAB7]|uniref:ring-cleaving dioxygenase n=1 Tax=Alkalihalobacterium sp. APHAB7 TaxID=3402081 RepID=UPI003AB0FFE1